MAKVATSSIRVKDITQVVGTSLVITGIINEFLMLVPFPGVINVLLGWGGWLPLSRLSYTAYLIHPMVIYVHNYSRRTGIYMSETDVVRETYSLLCVNRMYKLIIY